MEVRSTLPTCQLNPHVMLLLCEVDLLKATCRSTLLELHNKQVVLKFNPKHDNIVVLTMNKRGTTQNVLQSKQSRR